jgi:polar amino acid transport system ATP-binding protein
VSALPLIDVARLEEPATQAALREACTTHGFFYAVNHGVKAAQQRQLEELTRAFFALPHSVKASLRMELGGSAWRGWFPVGAELTSGRPDEKEGLYFGAELPEGDGRPLHGPNLFPEALPQLKPVVLDWMAAMEALGQRVLEGLALSLGLPAAHFARALTREPLCLFRIFHYPPPAQPDGWGVGEHTDYGLLTLLKQDDCGGLEVKTPRGWVQAPPVPDSFVCNLGDMLDRMTGGLYRSTPHRVRNSAGRSRYSWPFFLDPGFEAVVAPLPGAEVRPAELDAAQRWDQASVHSLQGTYGAYLVRKVSKVFPQLQAQVLGAR